ncbi:PIK3CG [Symbiodinium sp. CCMP2592]|nr:PIK3CG [Symbiodinium sp. CCMP2592]
MADAGGADFAGEDEQVTSTLNPEAAEFKPGVTFGGSRPSQSSPSPTSSREQADTGPSLVFGGGGNFLSKYSSIDVPAPKVQATLRRRSAEGPGAGSAPAPVPDRVNVQLNQQIVNAGMPERILQIVDENFDQLNAVNLITALHRLAAISLASKKAGLRRDPRFKRLVNRLSETIRKTDPQFLKPQDLSNVAWGLTKLGIQNTLLFSLLSDRILVRIDSFQPVNLSMTLWAFARSGLSDERLLRAAAQEVKSQMKYFEPQQIANTTWAMAKCGFVDEELFEQAAEQAILQLKKFQPMNFSMLLYSFALAQQRHERLFEEVAKRCTVDVLKHSLSAMASGDVLLLFNSARIAVPQFCSLAKSSDMAMDTGHGPDSDDYFTANGRTERCDVETRVQKLNFLSTSVKKKENIGDTHTKSQSEISQTTAKSKGTSKTPGAGSEPNQDVGLHESEEQEDAHLPLSRANVGDVADGLLCRPERARMDGDVRPESGTSLLSGLPLPEVLFPEDSSPAPEKLEDQALVLAPLDRSHASLLDAGTGGAASPWWEEVFRQRVGDTLALPRDLRFPGHPDCQAITVEKDFRSASRARLLRLLPSSASVILKAADVQQEAAVMSILRRMNQLWQQCEVRVCEELVQTVTYDICSLSGKFGLVEVIPDSRNMRELAQCYPSERPLRVLHALKHDAKLLDRLAASTVAYLVAGYAVGLRDSHDDNIMLRADGMLFRVDFGYIFGASPALDAPPTVVPNAVITALGARWKEVLVVSESALMAISGGTHEPPGWSCLRAVPAMAPYHHEAYAYARHLSLEAFRGEVRAADEWSMSRAAKNRLREAVRLMTWSDAEPSPKQSERRGSEGVSPARTLQPAGDRLSPLCRLEEEEEDVDDSQQFSISL